jgi:hypothetical protein
VMMVKSQVLEQTLNNEPDLNVALVSVITQGAR